MENNTVTIQSIEQITHDVLKIVTAKPKGYAYTPGQATEISVNSEGWREIKKPFTFTGLPTEDHLEFTIKTYPERKGVTNELLQLKPYDELIVHEVFGAIAYKGEGVFIAGGAGVTPFISIFRHGYFSFLSPAVRVYFFWDLVRAWRRTRYITVLFITPHHIDSNCCR